MIDAYIYENNPNNDDRVAYKAQTEAATIKCSKKTCKNKDRRTVVAAKTFNDTVNTMIKIENELFLKEILTRERVS